MSIFEVKTLGEHMNPTRQPTSFVMPTTQALTLIEVMIAMVILVIGISTLFDSMVTSKRVNDRATSQAKAYEEIQAQIENLQYMPFASLREGFKGIAFNVRGLRPPGGDFSCGTVTKLSNPNPNDTTIAPINPNVFSPTDNILPFRIRVSWEDDQGPAMVETVYVATNRGY
jgi:prepilin-type N-terminal cleavage/methylation domain-containing protein